MRPLPPVLLNILAMEAVYLLPLRLLLLDEIMSDLTTLVDSYLNAFRQGSADPLGSIKVSYISIVHYWVGSSSLLMLLAINH